MNDTQLVWLKRFFWMAYGVFLAASIPHIATWFHHFDTSSDVWTNGFWWVVAYAIAITIDVTDVLLTVAIVKKMERNERGWASYLLLWSFVFAIMALSWFINWQYNVQYATSEFMRADNQAIFGASVGAINPLIGSAFQLFVLAYTAIAHTVLKKTETKTYEELQKELNQKQNMRSLQKQINTLKAEEREEKIAFFAGGLTALKKQGLSLVKGEETTPEIVAKTEVKSSVNTGPLTPQNSGQNDAEFSGKTESFLEVNDDQNDDFEAPKSDENLAVNEDQIDVLSRYPGMVQILSTGRSTVGLAELSAATEIGEKVLLNRVRNGTLKRTSRNEKVVYVDSVFSFLNSYKTAAKKGSEKSNIILLKNARKEDQTEAQMSSM